VVTSNTTAGFLHTAVNVASRFAVARIVLCPAAMLASPRLDYLATVALTAAVAGPSVAAADPADAATVIASTTAPSLYDVGFRVGGYGFRREGDPTPGEGWTECRMDGIGVFADRTLRGPVYLEAGVDGYTSSTLFETAAQKMDAPIDRISLLVSVAGGARSQLTRWLRGYVQLGVGVELTHVSMPYGNTGTIRDDLALPEGFFGVGADIRVARATYIGATMRMLVMGNFNYTAQQAMSGNQWVAQPTPAQLFDASPDLAVQGEFYFRRDL
jgi:hypothetical protein